MNNTSNELERERIIFLQGVLESDAKELSEEYPNLVIFSAGDSYYNVLNSSNTNDSLLKQEYDNNKALPDLTSNDIVLGSYIFKNGIKYNVIRGIHPLYGKIHFNKWEISLSIDHNGLLKLNLTNYAPRYFYVGNTNPLDELLESYMDGTVTKYKVKNSELFDPDKFLTEDKRTTNNDPYNNHEDDQHILRYQSIDDIFSNFFIKQINESYPENNIEVNDGNSTILYNKYGIDGAYRDFDISENGNSEAYIFLPVEYESLIVISNLLMTSDIKYFVNDGYKIPKSSNNILSKFQVVKETLNNHILMDDECEYMVIKVKKINNDKGYKRIRIYKVNDTN